jgi:hypothetical protein
MIETTLTWNSLRLVDAQPSQYEAASPQHLLHVVKHPTSGPLQVARDQVAEKALGEGVLGRRQESAGMPGSSSISRTWRPFTKNHRRAPDCGVSTVPVVDKNGDEHSDIDGWHTKQMRSMTRITSWIPLLASSGSIDAPAPGLARAGATASSANELHVSSSPVIAIPQK